MKLAIMQPTFNPWVGYFDLIDYVDKFVFLDTVQLNQQSWQTRNKIKVQNQEFMFSVPLLKNKPKSDLLIKDALINSSQFDFRQKLIKTLNQNYGKSYYYDEVGEFIQNLVLFDTKYLSYYNINLIKEICTKLDITTQVVTMSDLHVDIDSSKGDQVLQICNFFNASEYISPAGSKAYLDEETDGFQESGIRILYQCYRHPLYRQLGSNFIPYLGIFDLLYNEGFENSISIIKKGRCYK